MKLAVFGATGNTGVELVKQALERGHDVTAFVRTPEKMKIKNDKLTVVKADIFNEDSLVEQLQGHDAVVSGLGFSLRSRPVTGFLESIKVIVAAMRRCSIKRIVTITAMFTDVYASSGNAGVFVNWVMIPMIRPVLEGQRQMELYLENECSDISYTVVRPPGLTNSQIQDKQLLVEEHFTIKSSYSMRIPRANVAKFMLDQLDSDQYDKKFVAIALP